MNSLRRYLGFVLVLGMIVPAWATGVIALSMHQNELQLLRNDDSGFALHLSYSNISSFDVQTPQGTFSEISVADFGASQRIGEPRLPVLRRIFAVPLGANVSAEVTNSVVEEISLADYGINYPIMPAQPSVSKSQNPADVPFEYHTAAYLTQGYGDRALVHVEELGILRGVRLFALVIEPIRYDPSRQTLEVYNDLSITVRFSGGDLAATHYLRERTASPCFESMYRQTLFNYRINDALDEDLTRYPIKYVIISDPMFTAQLQPFIEWKTQEGYEVIVGYTNDPQVGNTTTSIHNYLQGLYDAGTPESPAPTFVLFVGDVDQIPTYSGTTGSHYTDVHYVRLDGQGNYLPEMYFGRFSARNTTELQPQIDKTLEYEKYEMPDPSYLGRVVMIGGVDGTYGQVWANGQINYGTTYYFNATHGITSNTYLYPGSGSQDAQIIANASDGRGYMNYTAHGSENGWADPTFTVANVNSLTNAHKYGTVVGNCCLTNSFQVATCFGEAWLRGEDKGAIGYIGASDYSYWDEDYWWGVGYRASIVEYPTYNANARGAYDGMFHDHGETFANWYTVQYAAIMAGNLAVVQSGSSLTNYYWEVYQLMGDPSLSTFFGVPSANTVSYPQQILIGQTSITVTAEPYSYVGLSYEGQLYASGLIGESGSLTVDFDAFTTPGDADIVITRQNRQPMIATIQVIPNEGPYLVTSDVAIDDDNHNGVYEYGESLYFTITEHNVGSEDATNVTVTLVTDDNNFSITDGIANYGLVPAGQDVSVPNGFAGSLWPNVPDGHAVRVDLTAADDQAHEWTSFFTFTASAPELVLTSAVVNDASGNNNGVMDPGETVELTLSLRNDGSLSAQNIIGTLTTDYTHATIPDPAASLASLAPGATAALPPYTVTIAPSAPSMDRAFFYLLLTMFNGRYESVLAEMSIGGFADAVESGEGGWTHAANQAGWADQWHISTEQSHSPTHAWKCGDTGTGNYANHMDAVLLTPAINLTGHSDLRFWHQIDAEVSSVYQDSAYDGGIIEISANGGPWTQLIPNTGGYNKIVRRTSGGGNPYTGPFTGGIPCWSGTIAWSEVACDLGAYSGSVQIRFRFGSDNGGAREGWYVDDIQISLVTGNNPPQNLTAFIGDESSAYLSWESPASGALTATLLGYNIYRDGTMIDSFIQASYYADPLWDMPYGLCHYQVSARYSDGESAMSNEAVVDWQGAGIGAVSDLTVSCTEDDVTLRWSPVESASEYHIYASDSPQSFEGAPITVTDTTYTLVDEVPLYGQRFYMVTAVRN